MVAIYALIHRKWTCTTYLRGIIQDCKTPMVNTDGNQGANVSSHLISFCVLRILHYTRHQFHISCRFPTALAIHYDGQYLIHRLYVSLIHKVTLYQSLHSSHMIVRTLHLSDLLLLITSLVSSNFWHSSGLTTSIQSTLIDTQVEDQL